MGGHDGSNYLASCEIFSASMPRDGRYTQWTEIGALEGSRAFHGSAAVRRTAYCFGGQGSKTGPPGEYGKAVARTASIMSTVEQMDIDEGVWRAAPSLPSARTMLSGAEMRGRIYSIGGREGKFDVGEVLSSVCAWDPRDPEGWKDVAPMSQKRCGWNFLTSCHGLVRAARLFLTLPLTGMGALQFQWRMRCTCLAVWMAQSPCIQLRSTMTGWTPGRTALQCTMRSEERSRFIAPSCTCLSITLPPAHTLGARKVEFLLA